MMASSPVSTPNFWEGEGTKTFTTEAQRIQSSEWIRIGVRSVVEPTERRTPIAPAPAISPKVRAQRLSPQRHRGPKVRNGLELASDRWWSLLNGERRSCQHPQFPRR